MRPSKLEVLAQSQEVVDTMLMLPKRVLHCPALVVLPTCESFITEPAKVPSKLISLVGEAGL
jgi:hypothetical protein